MGVAPDHLLGPNWGTSAGGRYLDDGTGSLYGIWRRCAGFGVFRSRLLLPFTAASPGAGGAGRDHLERQTEGCGDSAGPAWAQLLGLVFLARNHAIASLSGRVLPDPMFGPGDIPGSWARRADADPRGRLRGRSRPGPQMPGRSCTTPPPAIWTVPQAEFEVPPEAARRTARRPPLVPVPLAAAVSCDQAPTGPRPGRAQPPPARSAGDRSPSRPRPAPDAACRPHRRGRLAG